MDIQITILPFTGNDSRTPLKKVLAEHLDLTQYEFQTGPHGKPYLASAEGPAPVHFNLSHTRDLLLIAVSDTEVGIDVEALDRKVFDGLDRKILSLEERKYLQSSFSKVYTTLEKIFFSR